MSSLLPNLDYFAHWPPLNEQGLVARDHQLPPNGRRLGRRLPPKRPARSREDEETEFPVKRPAEVALPEEFPLGPPTWEFLITQGAFVEAMNYLCGRPPEAAGILLGPRDDEPLVTRFVPDLIGRGSGVDFKLHGPLLNFLLQEFKAQGLTCQGVIHSHPAGYAQPSGGDLDYFRRVFARPANATATRLFVPIVTSGRLHPYVFQAEQVQPATLVVV